MKFQAYRSCVCYALFCLTLSQQQLFPSLLISNNGQSKSFSHVEAFSITIEGPTASEWSTRDEYVRLLKAQEQQEQAGDIAQAPPMVDQQALVAEQLQQQQQRNQRQLLPATPSFENPDGSVAASGPSAMNIVLTPDSELQSATSLTRSRQPPPQAVLTPRDSFLVENNNKNINNNNYEQQLEETLDQLDSLHQQHKLLQQHQAKSNSNRRRQIQEDTNNYLSNQERQQVMTGGPSSAPNAFELIAATNSHQQNQNQNHNQQVQQQHHHPIISIIDNSGKTISRSLADLVAIGDSDLQEQDNGQDGDYLDRLTNFHPRIRERADLMVCGDKLIELLELVCEKRFFTGQPTIAEPIITKSRRSVNPTENNLEQNQSLSPLNHIPKKHIAANENDESSSNNNINNSNNNNNSNNDYYGNNKRSSRSIDDGLNLLTAGVNQNNNNNNYHDRKTASITLQQSIKPSRRAAMRRAREASDECCKNSCSIQQLKTYCERRP